MRIILLIQFMILVNNKKQQTQTNNLHTQNMILHLQISYCSRILIKYLEKLIIIKCVKVILDIRFLIRQHKVKEIKMKLISNNQLNRKL